LTQPRSKKIPDAHIRIVFKRSLQKSDWIRIARNGKYRSYTTGVNLIVPKLDLRIAKRVLVRNQKTREILTKMGFGNVIVKRLKVPEF
jgi:hypothetical protein